MGAISIQNVSFGYDDAPHATARDREGAELVLLAFQPDLLGDDKKKKGKRVS